MTAALLSDVTSPVPYSAGSDVWMTLHRQITYAHALNVLLFARLRGNTAPFLHTRARTARRAALNLPV